jgi:hypothetical protein
MKTIILLFLLFLLTGCGDTQMPAPKTSIFEVYSSSTIIQTIIVKQQ